MVGKKSEPKPEIDPEVINYGEGKKEIIFRETFKRHADLKIQLQYDELKMAKFCRECVTFYLNKDPLMMELVDRMKGIEKVSIARTEIAKRERKKTDKVVEDFALDDKERQSIFDMLAEEHPEL